MVRHLAPILALVTAGCSLLIDPSDYVGQGGDAGADAGADASPDAAAGPSAPVVTIAPSEPLTTDALVASIEVESVDPLGHPISYEWSWTRDGADAAIAIARVEPAATSLGEIWVVSATPVTDDGRRGPAGTASVTIENSPPVLRSIGLTSYRPIRGDTLATLPPCGLSDPDGGTPALHYVWRVDGEIVESATTSRFLLADVSPGAEITLEVHATDAEGAPSETVTVGPAVVVPDVTRWTQLLPDRAFHRHVIPDPGRCRTLIVTRSGGEHLWEHDHASGRFVRLRPEGSPGDHNAPLILTEPGGEHAYLIGTTLIGMTRPFEMTALDIPQRGGETWRDIPVAEGSTAPAASILSGLYDAERDRAVFTSTDGVTLDLWSVDVSSGEAVTTREGSGGTSTFGSTWVRLPGSRRVLVLGGADVSGGGSTLTPNDLVHELDLDDLAAGFVERSERLPAPLALPLAWADAERDRVIFGWGAGPSLAEQSAVYSMDLDSRTSTPLDNAGAPPVAVAGTAVVDPTSGRILLDPGTFSTVTYELYAFDPATDTFSGLHRTGVDAPPPLRMAIGGWLGDDFVFYGGRDGAGATYDVLWRANVGFGSEFRSFVRESPTPDPMHGTPGPRYGMALASNLSELLLYGGRASDEMLADTSTWRWTGSAWSRLMLDAATTPPAARTQGMLAGPIGSCGGRLISIGGNTGAGPTSDVATLACGGAPCTWTAVTTTGDVPSRHSGAIAALGDGELLLVGGFGGQGVVSAYDPCTRAWRTLTVDGPAPPDVEATISGDVLFGGVRGFFHMNEAMRVVRPDADTVRFDAIVPATDGDGLPPHRSQHVAGYFPDTQTLYVYGGWTGIGFFDAEQVHADLWMLRIR